MFKMVDGISVEMGAAEADAMQAEWDANDAARLLYEQKEAYKDKRRDAYPPIGDQLDALLKGFQSLKAGGEILPAELDSILSDWNAVKASNPKPA